VREEAIAFGERKSLVGIVTDPRIRNRKYVGTGVILLNPGIVHRVGPGRVYVKVARELASIGLVVLRFDFSGIGDSAVRHDNLRFDKSAVSEAQDAMECLAATRGIQHFIFLGGCSGAQISLETACCDARVIGAVLINFPVSQDEDGVANPDLINRRKSYYYSHYALFSFKSWSKVVSGTADYRQIARTLWFETKRRFPSRKNLPREATQFEAKLRRLVDAGVRLTFLCSEGDPRLEDLREAGGDGLKQLSASGRIALEIIPRSDHTFSSLHDQEQLLKVIVKRIETMSPAEKEAASRFPLAATEQAPQSLYIQS
jgi:pimeloyl-ACP methyl ester carboxylesterase